MVYTILISIVFVAELIIALTVIQNIVKLGRAVRQANEFVNMAKPSVKDISILVRKISEQFKELAQDFVTRARQDGEELILRKLSKLLMGILALKLNMKIVNKIRKSGVVKALAKGLSLLEIVV